MENSRIALLLVAIFTLSPVSAVAQNEVERYACRIPGQPTAYYYGYTKLQALRTQTELALRDHFDQRAFHYFVQAQGLLPPDIPKAVMREFDPGQRRQ